MHGKEVLAEAKPTMISFRDRFDLMLAALFMHVKWDRAVACVINWALQSYRRPCQDL